MERHSSLASLYNNLSLPNGFVNALNEGDNEFVNMCEAALRTTQGERSVRDAHVVNDDFSLSVFIWIGDDCDGEN